MVAAVTIKWFVLDKMHNVKLLETENQIHKYSY